MTGDPKAFLPHIRDACNAVQEYISNISETDFRASREKQAAVVREIEIIGEAVRNLPDDLKNNNPQIAWGLISSMRNFLIHEYFSIDLDLVWDTATSEIPHLKKEVEKIIQRLD